MFFESKYSLKELLDKNGQKPILKAKNSKVIGIRSRKGYKRFIFIVKSWESYSNKNGHIVSIAYPEIDLQKIRERKQQANPFTAIAGVHCTCPAFLYWGSHYWATYDDYLLNGKAEENRFPEINDPDAENLMCKHLTKVAQLLKTYSFVRLFNIFDSRIKSTSDQEIEITSNYKLLLPLASEFLSRNNYSNQDVEDVIFSIDENNYEDILAEHKVII